MPRKNANSKPSDSDGNHGLVCQRFWWWHAGTQWLRDFIRESVVVSLGVYSAKNPKRCILSVVLLTVGLAVAGVASDNLQVVVDDQGMYARHHNNHNDNHNHNTNLEFMEFVDQTFPHHSRRLTVLLHAQGTNVATYAGVDQMFQVLEDIQRLPGYKALCTGNKSNKSKCTIKVGPTRFWHHNRTLFQQKTRGSDAMVQKTLSSTTFPSGIPVVPDMLGLGHSKRMETAADDDDVLQEGGISFAESILSSMEFPIVENENCTIASCTGSDPPWLNLDFELQAIQLLQDMQKKWMVGDHIVHVGNNSSDSIDNGHFRLEFLADRTIQDEMLRSVTRDLPLFMSVFVLICFFTCLYFVQWETKNTNTSAWSRCWLGIGSVLTIGMSITSGYGLAFVCGIPITPMTQIVPFLAVGIGLDDTFIITGAYFRHDQDRNSLEDATTTTDDDPIVHRIRNTLKQEGNSISLTTITTIVGFGLGCISSSIPAIRWLCMYAFLTILIDFIYQITFFVALLVLNERHWSNDNEWTNGDKGSIDMKVPIADVLPQPQQQQQHEQSDEVLAEEASSLLHKWIEWYADYLLCPWIKGAVMGVFALFFLGCAVVCATRLTQQFDYNSFFADDSYALSFFNAANEYTDPQIRVAAYFRYIDQSQDDKQKEMVDYITDLSALPQINEPLACWVRDYQDFRQGKNEKFRKYQFLFDLNFTFYQQLDAALFHPQIDEIYGADIIRDSDDGTITASRCWFSVPFPIPVMDQIKLLKDMKHIALQQPSNQRHPSNDQAMFTADPLFYLWEFLSVISRELMVTTFCGALAMTCICLVLIPHWSAIPLLTPLIVILYIDLLGTIELLGLHINPATYVIVVTSLGLMVDFLMHILLRFYESKELTRERKVKEALHTMGASVTAGGLSTCLSVIPMAFSSCVLFRENFIAPIAMVMLGMAHGLIVLPVLLSCAGPMGNDLRGGRGGGNPKPHSEKNTGTDQQTKIAGESALELSPLLF